MDAKGTPEASTWAEKEGCGARVRKADVIDSKPGYVYDGRPQTNPSDGWGHMPKPGTAEVFAYPGCKNGRLVYDVVRIGKGHTEGLEPHRLRGTRQVDAFGEEEVTAPRFFGTAA